MARVGAATMIMTMVAQRIHDHCEGELLIVRGELLTAISISRCSLSEVTLPTHCKSNKVCTVEQCY